MAIVNYNWYLYTSLVKDRRVLHRYCNNELRYIYICLGTDLYLRLLNTNCHRYKWLEHSELVREIVNNSSNFVVI